MKLKQILLPILGLIATALIAVFIYDLLSNFSTDNLINATSNNVVNNQISARDVKNITSTLNNITTNSSISNVDAGSPASWIIGVSFGAFALVIVGVLACTIHTGILVYNVEPQPAFIDLTEIATS